MKRIALSIVVAISAQSAISAETLTEVISDVVVAEGMTAADIGDRAMQCIKSSSGNVADKVDPARDGDTAYAIVLTAFKTALGSKSTGRSRISVYAKDGRFKVGHSDIQLLRELTNDWGPIYMYAGAGGKQAKAALEARSAGVAACITKKQDAAPGGDGW